MKSQKKHRDSVLERGTHFSVLVSVTVLLWLAVHGCRFNAGGGEVFGWDAGTRPDPAGDNPAGMAEVDGAGGTAMEADSAESMAHAPNRTGGMAHAPNRDAGMVATNTSCAMDLASCIDADPLGFDRCLAESMMAGCPVPDAPPPLPGATPPTPGTTPAPGPTDAATTACAAEFAACSLENLLEIDTCLHEFGDCEEQTVGGDEAFQTACGAHFAACVLNDPLRFDRCIEEWTMAGCVENP